MAKGKKKSTATAAKAGSRSAAAGPVQSRRSRRNGNGNSGASGNTDGALLVPAASGRLMTNHGPSIVPFVNSGDARVTVRHRELICDIPGSVAFSTTKKAINPGVEDTFPWLCEVANNYESYRFRKLEFEFCTSKGTSTAGSVLMYIDFDASDLGPDDKIEAFSHQGAARGPCWAPNITLDASRANLEKFGSQRYVRHALRSGTDIKTYDVGNLWVCTSGEADTSIIGELYASYEVDLMTPQMIATGPEDVASSVSGGGTMTPAIFCGDAAVVNSPSQTLEVEPTVGGSKFIFLRAGEYLLEHVLAGTGLTTGAIAFGSLVGITIVNKVTQQAVAAGTSSVGSYLARVTGVPASYIANAAAVATTISGSVIRVSPYSATLT